MKYVKLVAILLSMGLCIFLGWWLRGKILTNGHQTVTECQRDTLISYVEKVVEKPVFVAEKVTDTMLVYVDSSRVTVRRDSLCLSLPKITRTYEDEMYSLAVSGYNPTLDYIKIKSSTQVVTTRPNLNHLTIEASAVWDKNVYAPIVLRYDYGDKWRIGAGMGYDPVTRSPVLTVRGSWSMGW